MDLPDRPEELERVLDLLNHASASCPIEEGIPAGFRGLVHEPSNEYETELLATLLLAERPARCCIDARTTGGSSDWHLWTHTGDFRGLRTAEIEYLASGYRHDEVYDELICWRCDRLKPHLPKVTWELRHQLELMPELARCHVCLRRQIPSFAAGTLLSEIPREFRFMAEPARSVFLEIVKALHELGVSWSTGTTGKREGITFHFAPGFGTETLGLYPGYSGRYMFPTIWLSANSLLKACAAKRIPASACELAFRDLAKISLSTSGKGRHIICGVSCPEAEFQAAVRPIVDMAKFSIQMGPL